MIGKNNKQCDTDANDGGSMNIKTQLAIPEPRFLKFKIRNCCWSEITEHSNKGGDERSDNKNMPEIADEVMNHGELQMTNDKWQIESCEESVRATHWSFPPGILKGTLRGS